jgi:chromosome partitioning protein
MQKIVFGLQKGGVGKTTTTLCTGAALGKLGKKVLLADFDPQANLTTSSLVDPATASYSTYDLFKGGLQGGSGSKKNAQPHISDMIIQTEWGFDLIPSSIALASAEVELASAFQREQVLSYKFAELDSMEYDYVLMDSPPSLGLLTINTLAAADQLVMPVQCQLLAIMGLQAYIDVVELVQRVNKNLTVSGVLLTMYDARTSVSKEVENNVREILGDVVFDTRIGNFTALSNIPKRGPIQFWDAKHAAAQQYDSFGAELVRRLGD